MRAHAPSLSRAGRMPLILALTALIFLSSFGCVEFFVRQQFYPNGRSAILEQIPLQNLIYKLNRTSLPAPEPYAQNISGWFSLVDDLCSSAASRDAGTTCHRAGDWLIIDQERVPGPDYTFVSYDDFPYRIYELTVVKIPMPPLPNTDSLGIGHLSLENSLFGADKDNVIRMRSMGIGYNYVVVMPGAIINYSAGNLTDRGLEVDGLEQLYARKPIFVRSKELDVTQLAMLAGFPLLMLLFFDFVAIVGYKEWKTRRDISEARRKAWEEEEARRRVFRRNANLKGNEVYAAPDEGGEAAQAPPYSSANPP